MERIEDEVALERQPFHVIQGLGEVAIPEVVEAQTIESHRFQAVDSVLEEKAPFFFSLRGFKGTISSRFRILNRAMSANVKQTPAGYDWRNTFDSVKSYNRGEDYYDTKIDYEEHGTKWRFRVHKVMEDPLVRTEVLARVFKNNPGEKASEDPAFHIYTYLREWPARNNAKPSEDELKYANRTLEIFLYSVHGRAIVQELRNILKTAQTSTEASSVE